MKHSYILSQDETYRLGYMEGYRIGVIKTVRTILINTINKMAAAQNYAPSKELAKKIMREIDVPWLCKAIKYISAERLLVKDFETKYDRLFFSEDEALDEV